MKQLQLILYVHLERCVIKNLYLFWKRCKKTKSNVFLLGTFRCTYVFACACMYMCVFRCDLVKICMGFVTYFVGGGDLDESFSSQTLESISGELLLLFIGDGAAFVSPWSSFDPGSPSLSSVASKLIRSMCVV